MDPALLLKRITGELNLLDMIYDVVRFVDPIGKKIYSYLKPDTIKTEELNDSCYEIWDNDSACLNCTSSRALLLKKALVKIEIKNTRVYLVTSIPVEQEDDRAVIELVKDITDSGILDIEGKNISQIQKLVNQKNIAIISDAITRVYNESFISERLPYDITRSQAEKKPLALLYAEIENLKTINDVHGSEAEEFVLKEVAKILRNYCRSNMDWTARYDAGGFILMLGNIDEKQAYGRSKRISDKFGKTKFVFAGKPLKIQASFGWYVLKNENITADDLLKKAISKIKTEKEKPHPGGLQKDAAEFFKKYFLTSRETEIAYLVLKGYSNAKIAQELYVSIPTVKKHLSAIFDKSGTMTRNEFSAKYREAVI